ncbi:PadR family transcriptional regulator [Yinghuangia seranimata]|uniref:PadR family transcriptional regulator n=1 Tax=Yinghuangia seranimata TaxID=408067 RepID=UPI00248CC7DC|nr:helix-turn-helix transcriptional regulator [Yinghuangia seranimata]MDI2124758.1 helix-turn-helix transcriptional regulator [Yinghuangia seranimata]
MGDAQNEGRAEPRPTDSPGETRTPNHRLSRVSLEVLASCAAVNETYGLALSAATGRPHGTVYPLLRRLEAVGLVAGAWETGPPQGRPRRRLYRITPRGRMALASAVAARDPQEPGDGRRRRVGQPHTRQPPSPAVRRGTAP